jgi:hypothetical protein
MKVPLLPFAVSMVLCSRANERYRRIADPQIRPITTGSDASDG